MLLSDTHRGYCTWSLNINIEQHTSTAHNIIHMTSIGYCHYAMID